MNKRFTQFHTRKKIHLEKKKYNEKHSGKNIQTKTYMNEIFTQFHT